MNMNYLAVQQLLVSQPSHTLDIRTTSLINISTERRASQGPAPKARQAALHRFKEEPRQHGV
jgi:hypothetical protein